MAEVPQPFVSVIIPVFNDLKGLRRCLGALAQQTYPRSHFEVIVVDNGSADRDDLKTLVTSYAGTLFAEEAIVGSYAARNKGLTLARGEIIAFTDADCIPAPDWLERGVDQLQRHPDCGMVVGKIDVFPENLTNPNLVERYQMVIGFPQEQHLNEHKGGATANVFTRRQVIDHVGPFMHTLKSFGDFEWGHRVYLAGYLQIYDPDVRVQHPARPTWIALRQKTERAAGGLYDYYVKSEPHGLKRNLVFSKLLLSDLIPPVNFAISVVRNPQVTTLGECIGVLLLLQRLRYISAWEKLRLRLGGISKRV